MLARRVEWKESLMLWAVAAVLVVLWLLGFVVFHVAGALIHILLLVAAVVIVIRLLSGRKAL